MNKALLPEITVNGEVIPAEAIAAEAQNHAAPKGKPGIAWRKAARALVVRALLLQEARRRGLEPDPAEVGPGRFETDEEALIRAVMEAEIQPEEITEEGLRAHWAAAPEKYRSPPLWEVSHILFSADPDDAAACANALKKAEAVTREALQPGARFAKLAAAHSTCGSRQNGGALGQLSPGDTVPEFEAALVRLEEGAVTPEPVQTRFGYHIIRMDAVAPGAPLPYEVVRPRLAEALEKTAWVRAAQAYTDQLVSSAEVTGLDLRAI
jgi:peptidyl-prolyl cis-trans isomerase C